jgi:putative FmdB family regulatory protein
MPIYEYKCSECGNVYEKRQKFSDPVDTVCNCEKQAPVTRLTSAPALVFKGSGWYINDYAKGKSGGGKSEPAAKSESSAKSDSGSSSSSGDSTSKSSSDSSSPAPAGKAS